MLTMHHIASDGWSLGVLVREVAALYPACLRAPRAGPRRCRSCRCSTRISRSGSAPGSKARSSTDEIAWWRDQLAGLPPLLELPTDRPRPRGAELPGRDAAGRGCRPGSPGGCEALAPERGGDPLHGAPGRLPGSPRTRCSGQDDLAVGSPVAGRDPPGDRAAHRVLRQHPGAAGLDRKPAWAGPAIPRSARSSAGPVRPRSPPICTRRCPSKSWSWSWRRSGASPTPRCSRWCSCSRTRRSASWRSRTCACGRSSRAADDRQVRSHGQPLGAGRRSRRDRRVRHRSVRRHDRRAAVRGIRAAARGGGRRRRICRQRSCRCSVRPSGNSSWSGEGPRRSSLRPAFDPPRPLRGARPAGAPTPWP